MSAPTKKDDAHKKDDGHKKDGHEAPGHDDPGHGEPDTHGVDPHKGPPTMLPDPVKAKRGGTPRWVLWVGGGIFVILVILSALVALRGWEGEEERSSPPSSASTPTASAPAPTPVVEEEEEPVDHCAALPRVRGMAPPVTNPEEPNDPANWTELVPGEPGCTLNRSVGLRVQCMNMEGEFVDYNPTNCAQGMGERYGSPSANPVPYTAHYTLS